MLRGEAMRMPDEVGVMLRRAGTGLGYEADRGGACCSRNTVKRYVAAEGWAGCRALDRPGVLAGLETWLAERFRRHWGNAGVVRQDLAREHGLKRKPADG
jgi:hypothetical protein